MKKMKKLFAGAIVAIAAGIVIAAVGIALLPESSKAGAEKYVEKTYRGKGDIDSISVNLLSVDVVVEPADIPAAEIIYTDNADEPLYGITEKGGRLSLERREVIQLFQVPIFYKNWMSEEEKLSTVYIRIPKEAVPELYLETTSGSIAVSDLKVKNLSVYGSSGDIWVKNTTVKENVDAETTAGEITLENIDLEGNLNCCTTSGDVNVGLTDALENYRISTETLSGDNNLPEGYDRGGTKEITVSTTSGNIHFIVNDRKL